MPQKLTAKELALELKQNLNGKGKMIAPMMNFFKYLTDQELEGLGTQMLTQKSKRQQLVVEEKIAYLQSLGYTISK